MVVVVFFAKILLEVKSHFVVRKNQNAVLRWFFQCKIWHGSMDIEATLTFLPSIIEPVHEISNNVVCATSKASDQPVHTRSLIRAFASRLNKC